MMKKFFVLSIVAIIAITGAACQKEEEPPIGSNLDGGSSTKSMVVFDETEFEPADVNATIYFGLQTNASHWWLESSKGGYSQAFFVNMPVEEYFADQSNFYKTSGYEEEISFLEELNSKPLESTTTIDIVEAPVFFVHHEKGTENYLSGKYHVDEVFTTENYKSEDHDYTWGRLQSVNFHYSQRVKIPEEMFGGESGKISFVYYNYLLREGTNGVMSIDFSYSGERLEVSYKKEKGKILLDKKVLIDEKYMKDVEILNLEETDD